MHVLKNVSFQVRCLLELYLEFYCLSVSTIISMIISVGGTEHLHVHSYMYIHRCNNTIIRYRSSDRTGMGKTITALGVVEIGS